MIGKTDFNIVNVDYDGSYEESNNPIGWANVFWPGMCILLYDLTGDKMFLEKAKKVTDNFDEGFWITITVITIWASNCSDKAKTLVASFGSPYLYRYYVNSKMAYVNAYSPSSYVIKAFVKAVFGDIEFTGKSSVEL